MKTPRQPRYGQIYASDEFMHEAAVEAWQRAIAHLTDTGNITPPRIEIADRYARAYAEYLKLYPEAAEVGPVKTGPNGGDVFNFVWSAVEKLNDRLAKFEAKLGIDVDRAEPPKAPPGKKTAADDYI